MSFSHTFATIISVLVFVLSLGADAASLTWSDSAGVISVEQYGNGQPILLIPGLMSDGTVWQDTVAQLSPTYAVHVINVAGFGRTPAVSDTNLAHVEAAIVDYIRTQQLNNPVVIGHSMGGFLAIALAVNPQVDVAKVMSVDGLPFIGPVFTRSNATTVAHLRAQAGQIKAYYQSLNADQLAAQSQAGLAIQATSDEAQQRVLTLITQSDPTTTGQIMHDLMQRDLRDAIANTAVPMVLLGASGGFSNEAEHDAAEALYKQQFANAPHAQVIMNTQARHFIMFDDPQWFAAQVNAFLGAGQ